jgi:GNAT superfamily N-acetyltransferase
MNDLENALIGNVEIDLAYWKSLKSIQTLVALEEETIVGSVSFGISNEDGSGYILWLHARENQEVTEFLLQSCLDILKLCPVIYAFWIASPLTLGIEALPMQHRPIMHQALLEQGFKGEDVWLYMAGPTRDTAPMIATVQQGEGSDWKLVVEEQGTIIAKAEVALERDDIGVLWWIDVQKEARGRGLGKKLFQQVQAFLRDLGAKHIILYVDHDDPAERDRTMAIHMYESHGFSVVDHLWSYHKGVLPK